VQERLQPVELVAVGEDQPRDRAAVDLADVVEDPVAEALAQLSANLLVLTE
jgi:hypothetical protein